MNDLVERWQELACVSLEDAVQRSQRFVEKLRRYVIDFCLRERLIGPDYPQEFPDLSCIHVGQGTSGYRLKRLAHLQHRIRRALCFHNAALWPRYTLTFRHGADLGAVTKACVDLPTQLRLLHGCKPEALVGFVPAHAHACPCGVLQHACSLRYDPHLFSTFQYCQSGCAEWWLTSEHSTFVCRLSDEGESIECRSAGDLCATYRSDVAVLAVNNTTYVVPCANVTTVTIDCTSLTS